LAQRGAGHDWTRFNWDAGRSGDATASTGINATNIGSLQRQQVHIDGTVDASAIYLHGISVNGASHDVLFVTTTYGKTLAIDANNGSTLWTFTPAGYRSWAGSAQITNATPVADPSRQFIYAASPDGHIQKIAVANGQVAWSTAITRLPRREKIASALNYFRGRVIAVTGGYIGDARPYQGHVVLLDASNGRLLHMWNSLCSDRQDLIDPHSCGQSGSAIWARGGAVIDSTTGDIFLATGNGHWDGHTDWGDSVLQLDPDATRLLANYTPKSTEELDQTDADLGSTSPVLLGDGYVAQGGKDGRIRLLSRKQMSGAMPHKGGELQTISTPGATDLFSTPAVLHSPRGTWIFVADDQGTAAWEFRKGKLTRVWSNDNHGTSPILAGGLLYIYDQRGALRVYQPDTGRQIANLNCGAGHWNSPVVVDGKIVLPEGDANRHSTRGILDIWRLKSRH
jgi:outer membrane protein assembly factor BamB